MMTLKWIFLLSCLIYSSNIHSQKTKDYGLNKLVRLNSKLKEIEVIVISRHDYQNRYYMINQHEGIKSYYFEHDSLMKSKKKYQTEHDSLLITDYLSNNNFKNRNEYSIESCFDCYSVTYYQLRKRFYQFYTRLKKTSILFPYYN